MTSRGPVSPPRDEGGPPALRCRGLSVDYEKHRVLNSLDLDVGRNEVVSLLGPSGAGKTTLLYAVAGFLAPSDGEIQIGGRVVATARGAEPPERRGIGMVFQHYALWPHMTVLETVAYPARRAKVDRAEARASAMDLLERFDIAHLAGRRPAELSGGEQQRVGLARALSGAPSLHLFDEPTAHLDSALRAVFREEMASRRRDSGVATLLATHDAVEALAVSTGVALLRDGAIAQLGSPQDVYERPLDLWAARLTGPASIIPAHAEVAGTGMLTLTISGVSFVAAGGAVPEGRAMPAQSARVLLRPDWATLDGPLRGVVRVVRYEGPHTDYTLETSAGAVIVREPRAPRYEPGAPVAWSVHRAWVLGRDPA